MGNRRISEARIRKLQQEKADHKMSGSLMVYPGKTVRDHDGVTETHSNFHLDQYGRIFMGCNLELSGGYPRDQIEDFNTGRNSNTFIYVEGGMIICDRDERGQGGKIQGNTHECKIYSNSRPPKFKFQRGRGTAAAGTSIQTGDTVGHIEFNPSVTNLNGGYQWSSLLAGIYCKVPSKFGGFEDYTDPAGENTGTNSHANLPLEFTITVNSASNDPNVGHYYANTITAVTINQDGFQMRAPAHAPTETMNNSNIQFYLDEASNKLKVMVKYSDGTEKTGSMDLGDL